ncbi:hypothetical protein EBU99_06290 [bacterium]|nr:hypothetical protein [bacterium]
MKILFLFYTQAEGGAPGYLSRKGEDAAGSLAQTLFGFAQDSLHIQLDSGFEQRARSLEEDIRWRTFKKSESLPQAVRAASQLFSDLLLLSGEHFRSLKTAEPVAQMCGLPVCVDIRLDRSADDKPSKGSLGEGLDDLLLSHLDNLAEKPRCVCVATSQGALLGWLKPLVDADKWQSICDVMVKTTAEDSLPAVFACGYEKTAQGPRWIID